MLTPPLADDLIVPLRAPGIGYLPHRSLPLRAWWS